MKYQCRQNILIFSFWIKWKGHRSGFYCFLCPHQGDSPFLFILSIVSIESESEKNLKFWVAIRRGIQGKSSNGDASHGDNLSSLWKDFPLLPVLAKGQEVKENLPQWDTDGKNKN